MTPASTERVSDAEVRAYAEGKSIGGLQAPVDRPVGSVGARIGDGLGPWKVTIQKAAVRLSDTEGEWRIFVTITANGHRQTTVRLSPEAAKPVVSMLRAAVESIDEQLPTMAMARDVERDDDGQVYSAVVDGRQLYFVQQIQQRFAAAEAKLAKVRELAERWSCDHTGFDEVLAALGESVGGDEDKPQQPHAFEFSSTTCVHCGRRYLDPVHQVVAGVAAGGGTPEPPAYKACGDLHCTVPRPHFHPAMDDPIFGDPAVRGTQPEPQPDDPGSPRHFVESLRTERLERSRRIAGLGPARDDCPGPAAPPEGER